VAHVPTLPATCVGATASATVTVDARWLMAYAAGIADTRPALLDPARLGGIEAHPVFPVCPEWPVLLAVARVPPLDRLTSAERAKGVHARHDLHLHRPIVPGDELTTTATVVGLERRRSGVLQTVRLATVDADGRPVATTWQGSMFLGFDLDGDEVVPEMPEPVRHVGTVDQGARLVVMHELDRGAAHVYSECARIWNPIHTDTSVALAAGLPDIILHGTATLAIAVSDVIDRFADGDPGRIRRVSGSFTGMVVLPARLAVRLAPGGIVDDGTVVGVEVAVVPDDASDIGTGATAIRAATVVVGPRRT
jgi:acyl dehydratase